jgi:transcriptional regulator with XRE-family HTH domain
VKNLTEDLRSNFADEEYRYGYVESFLDTYIAAQIHALREQRKLEQANVAQLMGTKQSAISRLENVNYSAWTVSTLKRLARVFAVRLKISFEEFSTLPADIEHFNTANLRRRPFHQDPVFGNNRVLASIVTIAAEKNPHQEIAPPEVNPEVSGVKMLDEYMQEASARRGTKKPSQFDESQKGNNLWNSLLSSSPEQSHLSKQVI